MTENSYILDITGIMSRYDSLVQSLRLFLESENFPSVEAHLVRYINECSKFESQIISLKSEIMITKSSYKHIYQVNLREAYDRTSRFDPVQKWQSDILVYGEGSVIDAKKAVDILESLEKTLDEYKWLVKSQRESAKECYKFLSEE